MHIPHLEFYSPSKTGWGAHGDVQPVNVCAIDEEEGVSEYHVCAFLDMQVHTWILVKENENANTNQYPISQQLQSHETKIFHIWRVTPRTPQSIGIDHLHFPCCHEVFSHIREEPSKTECS
jgi:hypothetical protein